MEQYVQVHQQPGKQDRLLAFPCQPSCRRSISQPHSISASGIKASGKNDTLEDHWIPVTELSQKPPLPSLQFCNHGVIQKTFHQPETCEGDPPVCSPTSPSSNPQPTHKGKM